MPVIIEKDAFDLWLSGMTDPAHVGENATVCGLVASVSTATRSNAPTFCEPG
jgi:hypothetical protein